VGINFNSKILITNPTTHYLGRGVFGIGIMAIITGAITLFTGDLFIPAFGWCVLGVPPTFIGLVLMMNGVRKN
jgi:hypothetical protein